MSEYKKEECQCKTCQEVRARNEDERLTKMFNGFPQFYKDILGYEIAGGDMSIYVEAQKRSRGE